MRQAEKGNRNHVHVTSNKNRDEREGERREEGIGKGREDNESEDRIVKSVGYISEVKVRAIHDMVKGE